MKPFFARVGGKTKLSKFIISLMPKNYQDLTYVEPFVGAGAVLFRKEPSKEEIINDLDKDIYYLYKDIKRIDNLSNFNFKPSRKLFEYYLNNNFEFPKRLERNLYLSYNSFGSSRTTFAPSHVVYKKNVKPSVIDRLPEIQERLRSVKIYNKNFADIVKKYDSPSTLFYLDPPYESNETEKDYTNHVKPEEVLGVIKNIKGKFILSYNNSKNIRQLFKDFKIRKVRVLYNRNNVAPVEKTELIITNY